MLFIFSDFSGYFGRTCSSRVSVVLIISFPAAEIWIVISEKKKTFFFKRSPQIFFFFSFHIQTFPTSSSQLFTQMSSPTTDPTPELTATSRPESPVSNSVAPVAATPAPLAAEAPATTTAPPEAGQHTPATKLPTPPPQQQSIETNPDYIALTSALALLQNQRNIACKDLVELQRLKSEALSDPQAFLQNLQQTSTADGSGSNGSRIPKMQRVVKAPLISWKNYGIQGQDPLRQQAKGIMENHPSFSSVRLFDNE